MGGIDRLRRHLAVLDRDVGELMDRFAQHVQCREGCSECCHQTFRVSAVEGEWLRVGLSELPAAVRRSILARARIYRPDRRAPCPVLSDRGHCQLYGHRPRICRKYGLPLWHPDRPHEVTTCRLNFRDAHDVDAEPIVEPQAEWARQWIALRDALPSAPNRTIAEHLCDEAEKPPV